MFEIIAFKHKDSTQKAIFPITVSGICLNYHEKKQKSSKVVGFENPNQNQTASNALAIESLTPQLHVWIQF